VVYCEESLLREARGEELPFLQIRKTSGGEWSGEKEWRLKGDLDLRRIPLERLLVMVPSEREAQEVKNHFGVRVVTLEREG